MKWKYNNLKIVFKLIIASLNLQNCDAYFELVTLTSVCRCQEKFLSNSLHEHLHRSGKACEMFIIDALTLQQFKIYDFYSIIANTIP